MRINVENKNTTLNRIKPFKNGNKNHLSFSRNSRVKRVPTPRRLLDNVYE